MSAVLERYTHVLAYSVWSGRQAAHERRVSAWIDPHRARTSRGEKHPVYHFLFSYYGFRPAWLKRWHPGPDVILQKDHEPSATLDRAAEFLRWPEYARTPEGVTLDLKSLPESRRAYAAWLRELLRAISERPPFFGCFGLHEWAMVYRQTPDEIRHNAYPLRFSPSELAAIVERSPLCCTHHDAFRFFTPPARPLNKLQPSRADVSENEQRGCLHANMDLYKWAFKLAPFAPSELLADCFELARDIREIDMRASPYDLRTLGFEPIPIENPGGRVDYEKHQRSFSVRGEPLRLRLIALCDRLLAS
ncbi:MAG: 3-methyladenine DNA glycosylase [Opitutus sp.]